MLAALALLFVVAVLIVIVELITIGDNFPSDIITLWTGSAMWCRGGSLVLIKRQVFPDVTSAKGRG
jgi:hypothetical protein